MIVISQSAVVADSELWKGERRTRKLCDKTFSHPLYFLGRQPSSLPCDCLKEDVMCSELLCTFSTTALSLQTPLNCLFTSCRPLIVQKTVCILEYSTYITHRNCGHRFHFLCSRLSSSGTMFSQCEKENTQDVLYPWLQNNGVSLITRCYPPAFLPLVFWGFLCFFSEHGLSFTQLCEMGLVVICSTIMALPLLCFSSQTLRWQFSPYLDDYLQEQSLVSRCGWGHQADLRVGDAKRERVEDLQVFKLPWLWTGAQHLHHIC